MARRIPLPRLTGRQRLARWQRERRQQVITLSAFASLLLFVVGLVAWAGATNYYDQNLKPAARLGSRTIPLRDFNRRFTFDKVKFFIEFGVPEAAENHPQLRNDIATLRKGSLDAVVLGHMLSSIASEDDLRLARSDIDARVERDFGEVHTRHILVKVDDQAKDKDAAEADARAKAEAIAKQLQADPKNDELWKDLAAKSSDDPGSKDSGGELPWAGRGFFVREYETAMYALSDGQVSDPVKSVHGYHVIQRLETHTPTQTALWARLRKSGLNMDDLRLFARQSILRDRYEQNAKDAEIPSPQEQARVAMILVRMPPPTDYQSIADALKKIKAVTDGLEQGKDFAELAKQYSDDAETKEHGGELGWVTRAMLPRPVSDQTIADDVFAKSPGERSDQHALNSAGDIVVYQVLEKDAARAVTDEQKAKIRDAAFTIWIAKQESRLAVQRLIPGLEF